MKLARRRGEEQVVRDSATARFLHVANGSCTTDIIEAAGHSRRPRAVWADPLLRGAGAGRACATPRSLERAGALPRRAGIEGDRSTPMNDLRAPRLARRRSPTASTYDELVLWFEHDLFDQLNLVQLLDVDPRSACRCRRG